MIGRYTLIKVFTGSLFVQSSWSYEKMQSLGFASAITPALREIYSGKAPDFIEAQKRHMSFYNAHPYMASAVLGACINLEERAARGECRIDAPELFKKMVMGPYGAIGDAFFWGSLRPFASAIGVLSALLWGLWGPVVFLIVYNSVHLWMRWYGLKKGYELGTGVVELIRSLGLPERGERLKTAGAVAVGAIFAVLLVKWSAGQLPSWFETHGLWRWATTTAFVAVFVLSYRALGRGLPLRALVYPACALPVILMIALRLWGG